MIHAVNAKQRTKMYKGNTTPPELSSRAVLVQCVRTLIDRIVITACDNEQYVVTELMVYATAYIHSEAHAKLRQDSNMAWITFSAQEIQDTIKQEATNAGYKFSWIGNIVVPTAFKLDWS